MSSAPSNSAVRKRRSRVRPLIPLIVWFAGAVSLICWAWCARSLERTILAFGILVDGQPTAEELRVTLDGQPFEPGGRVGLGRRTLAIEGPTTEPYRKTAFMWFGRNDWGKITVARVKGVLQVSANPMPRELRITGRLFSAASTNARGFHLAIPVGDYEVLTTFKHLVERRMVSVRRNETNQVEVKPALGVLDLSAEPQDADFRLWSTGSQGVDEQGKTPAQLTDLPAAPYRLRAWRGDYVKESPLEIKSGQTNREKVVFEYGEVRFVTRPEGVKVMSGYTELGKTPLTLRELKPGEYGFGLDLEGYLPAKVPLTLRSKDSIVVETNLMSRRYAAAMDRARSELRGTSRRYRAGLAVVNEALTERPGDPEAVSLKAKLEAALEQEEKLAAQAKAAGETKPAAEGARPPATVAPLPAATPAPSDAVPSSPKVPAPTDRRAQAEANFKKATGEQKDNEFFDLQVWKTKAGFAKSREALLRYVEKGPDKWTLGPEKKIDEKMSLFELDPKGTFSDRKVALVQLAEMADQETEVRCKIWIYTVTNPLGGKWVPVHSQFYFPENPSTAHSWRDRVTSRFKSNLEKELGVELKIAL